MKYLLLLALAIFTFSACQNPSSSKPPISVEKSSKAKLEPVYGAATGEFVAKRTALAPTIDGLAKEACWVKAEWYPMDQRWLGEAYTPEDFQGRYKLAWDENYLYVLAEIVDDTLIDIHEDGLLKYWDDDCLEIFIDENRSKGNHQYSHNAFAYHIALDNKVVDIGPDSVFRYYNDHIESRRRQQGKTSTWEVAMAIYDDSYQDDSDKNVPLKLQAGKVSGFAIAYCDNDYSAERENFIGSVVVKGEDKNRGWIDAGIFGNLSLIE